MNMRNWGPRPNYEQVRMDEMGGGPRDGDDPGGGRRVALLVAMVVLAIAILVVVSSRWPDHPPDVEATPGASAAPAETQPAR